MAYRPRFKKKFNVMRIVGKIAITLAALWGGGLMITVLGQIVNGTCSGFYSGVKIIGWTVDNLDVGGVKNCITDTSGAGMLAVVGILALISIMMEFIEFQRV